MTRPSDGLEAAVAQALRGQSVVDARPLHERALEARQVQELQDIEGLPPLDDGTLLRWNERHYLRLVSRSLLKHGSGITRLYRVDDPCHPSKALMLEIRRRDGTGAGRTIQMNMTGTHGFIGHGSSPLTPSDLARRLAGVE